MQQKPEWTQTLSTLCHINAASTPLNSAMVAHTPQTWTLQSWQIAHQCAHRTGDLLGPLDHAAIRASLALHGLQGSYALTQLA